MARRLKDVYLIYNYFQKLATNKFFFLCDPCYRVHIQLNIKISDIKTYPGYEVDTFSKIVINVSKYFKYTCKKYKSWEFNILKYTNYSALNSFFFTESIFIGILYDFSRVIYTNIHFTQ